MALQTISGLERHVTFGFSGAFCFLGLTNSSLPKGSEKPWLHRGYMFGPKSCRASQAPSANPHCLKQFSRCHRKKWGCRRSWARSGGSARPVSRVSTRPIGMREPVRRRHGRSTAGHRPIEHQRGDHADRAQSGHERRDAPVTVAGTLLDRLAHRVRSPSPSSPRPSSCSTATIPTVLSMNAGVKACR